MTSRILPFCAALASLTLFSCYPLPDPQPHGHQTASNGSLNDPDQLRIEKQREELRKAQEERDRLEHSNTGNDPQQQQQQQPPTRPTQQKKDYPFGQAIPGKDGFVLSPFNNKQIDVRDIPSGTLVADPTYPASEKKYFRVP